MNTYEQIVRELAESAPFPNGAFTTGPCKFCDVLDHQQHETDCLWLRAKRAAEDGPLIEKEIAVSEKKEVTTEHGAGAWVEETPLYLCSDGLVRWQK